jgi:hypothetical protein
MNDFINGRIIDKNSRNINKFTDLSKSVFNSDEEEIQCTNKINGKLKIEKSIKYDMNL